MYDYDEEPNYEPMPEFLEKIHELVIEGVHAGRAEMDKEIKELRIKNKLLADKNYELSRQVGNMDYEIKKQIEAARKEFERELFGGFLRGDTFYYADFNWGYTPCETCKGAGKLSATLADGETVKVACIAQNCNSGKIQNGIYKVKEAKIQSVNFEISEYGKRFVKYWYRADHSDKSIDHEKCFKTPEEAQIHCDKRTEEYQNKNQPKGSN